MTVGREILQWLDGFALCVQEKDFRRGRAYFHPKAYCFGSYARACVGLNALMVRQWKQIWPNITAFRFRMDNLRVRVSEDGRLACVMALWHSIGYRISGAPFRRDGRVTIVLTRAARRQRWLALHTHYSLIPGTPQTNVKRRRARA